MITYGEPPRYVRFRVDRTAPDEIRVFTPVEFPHAIWVEYPSDGICKDGKPLYNIVRNSVWQARLAAGTHVEDMWRYPSQAQVCECMGEIIE